MVGTGVRQTLPGMKWFFALNGKPTFEIPYARINNTNLTSKNEVGIEFNIQDEEYQPAGDELVEMRFYIPGVIQTNVDENMTKKEESSNEVVPKKKMVLKEKMYKWQ